MSLKICSHGHLTGFRHYATCGTEDGYGIKGTVPPILDKKAKLAIDRAIRASGGTPVRDMGRI